MADKLDKSPKTDEEVLTTYSKCDRMQVFMLIHAGHFWRLNSVQWRPTLNVNFVKPVAMVEMRAVSIDWNRDANCRQCQALRGWMGKSL